MSTRQFSRLGLTPFQSPPELRAQVQKAYQFACFAGRVLGAQAAQGLEVSCKGIESGFIKTENVDFQKPPGLLGSPRVQYGPVVH